MCPCHVSSLRQSACPLSPQSVCSAHFASVRPQSRLLGESVMSVASPVSHRTLQVRRARATQACFVVHLTDHPSPGYCPLHVEDESCVA